MTGAGTPLQAIRGVLIDIDGVLVVSWEQLPGAADALADLRAAGLPLRFLTNTTSATVGEIADRLAQAGLAVGEAEILTAGVATADHLERVHERQRCFVLNEGPLDDLRRPGLVWTDDLADAEVVVIGAGGPSFGWETMNDVLRALRRGAALVGMHGARVWQTADGLCLDGGAYLDLLQAAAGVEATVVGKPAPGMFEAALAAIDCPAEAAVMVGDDVVADVLAAQDVGCTGILVRTGKYRPEDETRAGTPDHVVDSFVDVPALVGAGPG
jgi:HAD superfamily hydrolase (TIGR01458 family)